MSKHLKDYLYEEKYHPKRLSDVILSNRIRSMLQGIIDSGNIPGFLFSGSPGTGKTTCAKIICEEIGVDYHVIEGSVNNGIDFVRGALFELAQSSSSNGKYSVIIIDEADYLTKNSQSALRNIINLTQGYCRWILTANYPQKIIPAIRSSRLVEIPFAPTRDEILKEVAPHMWKRMNEILKSEKIGVEDYKSLQKWMVANLPNIRYILKSIQIMGAQNSRVIPASISLESHDITVEGFKTIVKGNYENLVKFVYATPQEVIMEFFQEHLTEIVLNPENYTKALTLTSQFQSMQKGVEEIYTISWLLNLKTLI